MKNGLLRILMAAGIVMLVAPGAVAAGDAEGPSAPRQLYNDGTKKLREGKLPEAEACLESAVATQNDTVQSPALYNLGETRFREGAEALKKGPQSQTLDANAHTAAGGADRAIRSADAARAGDDIGELVAAYIQGRGARKDLKSATVAVQKALETFGSVLAKWQRAEGDFRSAFELRPSDTDAKTNAEIVDRNIAKLVDQIQMMQQQMDGMKGKREQLQKKMAELKGRIPQDQGPKLAGPGDDDGDDEDKGPEPKPGDQEPGSKEGKEMFLTREEAARLLDMLKLDTNRKLAVSEGDTGKVPEHKGRDW